MKKEMNHNLPVNSIKNGIVYKFFIGFLVLLLSGQLYAQLPNTMYFMPGVPQSNKINPAIQPGCSVYLGFPGLAPVRMQIISGSLSYSDVLIENEEIDSLILPFHPLADTDEFLRKLKGKNNIQTGFGVSLASLGFLVNGNFFSFDISTRGDINFYYPGDLFELPVKGFGDGQVTDLGGFGADVRLFNEMAFGWSQKDFMISGLDVGIKAKALFGIANLATKESDITLATSITNWNLDVNMGYAVSTIPLLVNLDNVDLDDPNADFPEIMQDGFSIPSDIFGTVFSPNRGLGLDIGANYKITNELQVSASLIDLGYIRWKNSIQLNYNFEYEFKGINAGLDGIDTTLFSTLADSLLGSYSFTQGEAYTTGISPKLFIGAAYYPIEKIGFGLLSRTDFLNSQITQQFTGTVNMTTGKFLNFSLSASYMQRSLHNVGAGLSVNLGPFNMYMISDNLISSGLRPTKARSVNLWFGMNLTFGWKKASKKVLKKNNVDSPMVQ